jgi:hypothetical protein
MMAVILFAAAAAAIILSSGTVGGSQQRASWGAAHVRGGGSGAATAAAVRKQAAVWVARQVNGDVIVSCDPAMCAALQAAGVAAGRLLALGPGQGDPLGSEVLIATPAVRSQFGGRLGSVYAPAVLASFGSGTTRIEIRVVAPDGAAAYLAGLAADAAARKAAGAAVLGNSAIHTSPAARSQLAAGRVDSRLLLTVVTLAHTYPIDIISFGSPARGASAGMPLRSAEIACAAPAPGHWPTSLQALRTFFSAQRTPYRPAVTTVRLGRRTVLDVEYPAPTPLGLLGSQG